MSRTDRVKTGAQSRQSELYSVTSIRALLRAWHNPAALRKHPLLGSRLVQQRQRQSGEGDLAALRQIIEELPMNRWFTTANENRVCRR
jgi:hypothetical protein